MLIWPGWSEAGTEEALDFPGVDAVHEGVLLASGRSMVSDWAVVLLSLLNGCIIPLTGSLPLLTWSRVDHLCVTGGALPAPWLLEVNQ